MSLISVNSLSKSYGHRDVFAGMTFSIEKNARLGVVGPNGIGKTTLLRILAGVDDTYSGTLTRARNVRIGYLPQEADLQMNGTLWDACESVFADLIQDQKEMGELEVLMADPAQTHSALERYGELQHKFERLGGYTYQIRIKQVLTGLGFAEEEHRMSLDHLSGGQRTRAFLARLLLTNPDVLLLDEPTNHLDISAVEWLEGYLINWEGSTVVVSHDRYFLDKIATGILEMTAIGMEEYRGNYSHYLKQRHERWERRHEVFDAEKEKLTKDMEYIKKHIAGQNTLQAKGKLKRLSRIIQGIEQVGIEAVMNTKWIELGISTTTSYFSVEEAEKRLRGLRLPEARPPHLHLHLRAEQRSGDLVIRTKNLKVGYEKKPLFTAPDIELRRTDCAAVIGPNGSGKSTFLKTVLGQLKPLAGEVIMGASLNVGYFAQAHEGLNPEYTLMEEIHSVAPNMLDGAIRQHLAKFIFSGDDVYKKVDMLSGGERGRLALAKLALYDTNLLLLDEPTNHLDITSQEILEEVLDAYNGTILLVSHDRYLIDEVATQIWEIDPDTSRLTIFKGTYSELRALRESALQDARIAALNKETISSGKSAVTSTPMKQAKAKSEKEERRKKAQIQELENKIAALETKIGEVTRQLEVSASDTFEVIKLSREYESLHNEMNAKIAEWEGLQ